VVVPWAAGVASALGLVAADPSVIEIHAHLVAAADADAAAISTIFDDLAARALDSLGRAAGDDQGVQLQRVIEARYPGQVHQLAVEMPAGELARADLDAAVGRFHELYRATYGIDTQAPVQFVTYRMRAVQPVEKPEPLRDQPAAYTPEPIGTREVFFAENGAHTSVPVYRWEDLARADGFGRVRRWLIAQRLGLLDRLHGAHAVGHELHGGLHPVLARPERRIQRPELAGSVRRPLREEWWRWSAPWCTWLVCRSLRGDRSPGPSPA
jgi:hypothetical protein